MTDQERIESIEHDIEYVLKPVQNRVANMSNTYGVRMSEINKNHRQLIQKTEGIENLINHMAEEFQRQINEVREEFSRQIAEVINTLSNHRGSSWINNGVLERRWNDVENMPAGFTAGRLPGRNGHAGHSDRT